MFDHFCGLRGALTFVLRHDYRVLIFVWFRHSQHEVFPHGWPVKLLKEGILRPSYWHQASYS